MNQDIKQRWVDALRSGEYEQGLGCLHNSSDNSFCCLGVLTDLYIKEHGQQWHRPNIRTRLTFQGEDAILPHGVMQWAGLNSACPRVGGSDIASHNDYGISFNRLAAFIEDEL